MSAFIYEMYDLCVCKKFKKEIQNEIEILIAGCIADLC